MNEIVLDRVPNATTREALSNTMLLSLIHI